MLNIFSGFISLFVEHSSSFVAASYSIGKLIWQWICNFFYMILNFIISILWTVVQWVLGVMEAFEYIVNSFLGINATVNDYYNFAVNYDFLDILVDVFRAILGVSIVLLIIFTIYAIFKQEWAMAASGFEKKSKDGKSSGNSKGIIIKNLILKLGAMFLLPITMIFIFYGISAVLSSFSRALIGDNNATIAARVLSSSTYTGNKYRMYANENKRLPIIIQAYNTSDYAADENVLLAETIRSYEVQNNLINASSALNAGNGLSFQDSVKYQGNKITNSAAYGDIYETFVCTAEQYRVMADFIDYCEESNLNYYIKAVDDDNIEWKYVDSTVYNQTDNSLTINYVDASDIDRDGNNDDTYSITYSTSYEVTSPISNALETILALLGIGDYSDNKYNIMEREDGSTNIVQWSNEKVLIKFSENFEIDDASTWTATDEIIMYEYYHFSSNNTFGDYEITDLLHSESGVLLDANQIAYRDYYPETDSYSPEKTIDVVYINGTYYKIELSKTETNEYGNYYYVLSEIEDVNFLDRNVVTISQRPQNAYLMLSSDFDINDIETWLYTDQIIIYEYYKDLSYNNNLSKYSFSDFYYSDTALGVELPSYTISTGELGSTTSSNAYVLLNGTYYRIDENTNKLYSITSTGNPLDFLTQAPSESTLYYNYSIKLSADKSNGVYFVNDSDKMTASEFVIDEAIVNDFVSLSEIENVTEEMEKYSSFTFTLSDKFDYKDVETWTYRDYFLFYLYIMYPNIVSSLNVLKYSGLVGDIGKGTIQGETGEKYLLKVELKDGSGAIIYFDIDKINSISELNVMKEIDEEETLNNNNTIYNQKDLFITELDDVELISADTEYVNFSFSDDFSLNNIATWTVQDMLLVSLAYENIICDVSTSGGIPTSILENGYSSLMYRVEEKVTEKDEEGNDVEVTITNTLYKFGSEFDPNNNEQTIYLNGYQVTSYGYASVDEWLRENAMDFICRRLGTSSSSLIADYNGIIDNIFAGYNDYILTVNEIVNLILNNAGHNTESSENVYDIFDNIVTYTYQNPNSDFSESDISTWSNIDFAIYYITGRVSATYTSNVISYNNKNYFVIGDYAIDISGNVSSNPFAATITENNVIESISANLDGQNVGNLNTVYNNLLTTIMHDESELNELTRVSNAKFNYVTDKAIDMGSSANALPNGVTYFDVVLAGQNGSFLEGVTYSFDIFTDGTNNYLKINDKFVEITNNPMSQIYYRSRGTITFLSTSSVFAKISEYTPFQNLSSSISKLEGIIYSLTGSKEAVSYPVFSYSVSGTNSKSYIYVDGTFIEYNVTDTNNYTSYLTGDTDILNTLYNEYYRSLVTESESGLVIPEQTQSGAGTASNYHIESSEVFNLDNIDTWSPLKIILYVKGIYNQDIVGSVLVSLNGNRKYFTFSNVKNGITKYYCINITDIANIIEPPDSSSRALIQDREEDNINIKLYMTLLNKVGDNVVDTDETINGYKTFNNYISDVLDLDGRIVEDYTQTVDLLVDNVNSTFNITNPSTWNWFDLIYYSYTKEARQDTLFVVYVDSANNKYIQIESSASSLMINKDYLKVDLNTIRKQIATNNSYNVSFSGADAFKPITIIVSKLKNVDSDIVIDKYSLMVNDATNQTVEFYYFVGSNGIYNVIYSENPNDLIAQSGSNSVSNEVYSYASQTVNSFMNYDVFDYIISYVLGSNAPKDFSSQVYSYNGVRYLRIEDNYINISDLEKNNIISLTKTSDTEGRINAKKTYISDVFGYKGSLLKVYTADTLPDALKTSTSSSYGEETYLSFSNSFDPSDYSTWQVSDFIIYYLYAHGDIIVDNFQEDIVNVGGPRVNICNIVEKDEYGNSSVRRVIRFIDGRKNGTEDTYYLDYEVFVALYARKLMNIVYKTREASDASIGYSVSTTSNFTTTAMTGLNFEYSQKVDVTASDFLYNNYYYFIISNEELLKLELTNVSESLIAQIENGSAISEKSINVKLSDNFNINKISTWTVLEYIIITEFSRNAKDNFFDGLSFGDLKKDNYYYIFEQEGSSSELVLAINGNYYNITRFIEKEKPDDPESSTYKAKDIKINNINIENSEGTTVTIGDLVTKGDAGDYSLKVLKESIRFIVGSNDLIYELDSNSNSFTYSQFTVDSNGEITVDSSVKFNRWLDERLAFNYQVDPDDWDNPTISVLVKKVNWPQKLMNDMQVIYPDLNWETLIATNGWIDSLGEFSSGIASGEYVTEGNSANINAVGLVLSEFFVSLAKESEKGFADYEYESVFDEEVLDSLMLAMLGEDNYETLKLQAEIYTDMFNTCLSQVLDDIAFEKGIEIVDGKVDNFVMSVYKAYLSTLLLSSDLSEYLYKVATRVYAQYTIYEYLANASGDYAKYYAYINNLADENGETVDAFKYASFYELAKYENQLVASETPTFTFNFVKVYRHFNSPTTLTDDEIRNLINNQTIFNDLLNDLDDYYEIYYGEIEDDSELYCFMLDAYWSIYYDYKNAGNSLLSIPDYITLYHDYILGNMTRWDIVSSVSMDGGSQYMQYYDLYQAQLLLYKGTTLAASIQIYFDNPSIDLGLDSILENFETIFNGEFAFTSVYNVINECFKNSSSIYKEYVSKLNNLINLVPTMLASEKGDIDAWNELVEINNAIIALSEEFTNCVALSTGNSTANGTVKLDSYSETVYENTLTTLLNFQTNLQNYITAQEMVDKITKTSVTFALTQYSQNYVSAGYDFVIENRTYTLRTTVSSSRLAEYVYGGSFLTQFGIDAVYTSNDFEGIIQLSKAYDSSTNSVKTKLVNWKELREFASRIADFTARLYYMTNLNDLSENLSDAILMTDYVTIQNSNGDYIESTLEYAILDALINSDEFDISADTLISLMFGDTVATLNHFDSVAMGSTYKNVMDLARSLDGSLGRTLNESEKLSALSNYLLLVQDNIYSNYGYYNNNNNASERIHLIFVNVFTYLLVSEEDQSGENPVSINFENWTMKDFRTLLMEFIVDYTQNPSETGAENAARYLAIFKLLSSQFDYVGYTDLNDAVNRVNIGTIIGSVYVKKEASSDNNDIAYYYIDAKVEEIAQRRNILATFSVDKATSDNIIDLAGVSNRPIEELVNLEYDDLYDLNGNYDEAYGDSFVVCFYDEITGKYIPYMATSSYTYNNNGNFAEYMKDYGYRIRTNYYANGNGYADAYPIIAKGILTEDNKPTAIRMENYEVKYYRTNITTTGSLDDSALEFSKVVTETNTVGFTDYVSTSTFNKVDSLSNRNTMFIGSSNPTFYLESDFDVYFIQYTKSYVIPASDDFGGISVLDQFSSFYVLLEFDVLFLLALSFVTIFPLLFRATVNLMRRVLELIFYILAGPLAISMSALNYDEGVKSNQTFETWKKRLTFTLLSVFGYVIGFNVYFILLSTVSNMTFISDVTRSKISSIVDIPYISALGGFADQLIRCLFYIIAGGVIKTSADLLIKIVTAGKVERSFATADGDGTEMLKKTVGDIKQMGKTVQGLYTGETLMKAKDAALETVKSAVPGSAIMRGAYEGAMKVKTKVQGKAMAKALQAYGVPKSIADKAAKEFAEKTNKQREAKRQKAIKNANEFYKSMGSNFQLDDPIKPKEKKKKDNSAKLEKYKNKQKKKIEKKNKKQSKKASK